jgi:tRNA1(Val) A37 N6-methylase TrmN6
LGEENTEQKVKQQQAPITNVVGNPPYNERQKSENANNKSAIAVFMATCPYD